MIILNAIIVVFCMYRLLIALQQSGYSFQGIFLYNRSYLILSAISVVSCFLSSLSDFLYDSELIYVTIGLVVMSIAICYCSIIYTEEYKVNLKFTNRLIRIILLSIIMLVATQFIGLTKYRSLVWLTYMLLPIYIKVAVTILSPIEKYIYNNYVTKTKLALSSSKAIKIGITGSFGKTSTKNILAHILSSKYKVLATPYNYNTPLGISRCMQSLTTDTEIFIAEMGARHIGDIQELVDIVQPEIGIIKGVNNQHLETFRSLDNIVREKQTLAQGLIGRKFAVVNADNKNSNSMATDLANCVTVGIATSANYLISNLIVSDSGSEFDYAKENENIHFQTKLLGRNNATNIGLAVAVALELDVSVPEIVSAVNTLSPTPHRLQLINGVRGIKIIDDTYNANPDGVAVAIETLSYFKNRKVVVTAGMIELGEMAEQENVKLGEKIAEIADVALIIKSEVSDYILKGLRKYPEVYDVRIYVYDSLNEATKKFDIVLKANDVVLMLNDLPDSIGGKY